MIKPLTILLLCLLSCFTLSFAQLSDAESNIDVYKFKTSEQEQQFHELSQQLRCPKCQNNSIADSTAPLAQDLRQKVHDMLIDGKSKKEITDYMVARYGNFVTYEPPVTWSTIILWLGPLFFLIIGFLFLFTKSRRLNLNSKHEQILIEKTLTPQEQERLNALLQETETHITNTKSGD